MYYSWKTFRCAKKPRAQVWIISTFCTNFKQPHWLTQLRNRTFGDDIEALYQPMVLIVRALHCLIRGALHEKASVPSLFYKRRKPSPSHKRPLIRSMCLPQNRNNEPRSNGSRLNSYFIIDASPSMPRLRTV